MVSSMGGFTEFKSIFIFHTNFKKTYQEPIIVWQRISWSDLFWLLWILLLDYLIRFVVLINLRELVHFFIILANLVFKDETIKLFGIHLPSWKVITSNFGNFILCKPFINKPISIVILKMYLMHIIHIPFKFAKEHEMTTQLLIKVLLHFQVK